MTKIVFDKQSAVRIADTVHTVENMPYDRTGQLGGIQRTFSSVGVCNISNVAIPAGGVAQIYAVRDDIYYVKVPSFPSIKSFGVMCSTVISGGEGSMAMSGIVRAIPYNPAWLSTDPLGHRWNIYRNTCYVTPNSATGPFVSVGRDFVNGYILLRIDNSRNFGG